MIFKVLWVQNNVCIQRMKAQKIQSRFLNENFVLWPLNNTENSQTILIIGEKSTSRLMPSFDNKLS